jgi:hypothetical protein
MSEMHQYPQDHHNSYPGTFFFWRLVNDKVCAPSPTMPDDRTTEEKSGKTDYNNLLECG